MFLYMIMYHLKILLVLWNMMSHNISVPVQIVSGRIYLKSVKLYQHWSCCHFKRVCVSEREREREGRK